MPLLGSRQCQPVGWTACPAGFRADPSGWGCEAIVSAVACAGSTVERLGAEACVKVDDCAAAFPPADATLFVDASLTADDATHFRTITAALAAAAPSAVIAVEAGIYSERLEFPHPVKLVGRCAEQVILKGPGAASLDVGLKVSVVRGVEVRGMTVTAHRGGALVKLGGELTLTSVLLDDNREKGALATDPGSALTLKRSAVRRTVTAADGHWGDGVGVEDGASAALDECVVAGNVSMAMYSSGQGSALTVTATVVQDTKVSPVNNEGYGAFAAGPASVRLERSLLRNNQGVGLLATASSQATVVDSVIAGTLPTSSGDNGLGLYIDFEARLLLERSALVGNRIIALNVVQGGHAEVNDSVLRGTLARADDRFGHGANSQSLTSTLLMRRTALVDNREMGLIAMQGATATLERCLIRDTRRGPNGLKGLGVGAISGEGGSLFMKETALVKNHQAGLVVGNQGSLAELDECVLYGALRDPMPDTPLVQGAVVESGGRLVMSRSTVYKNQGVGLYASGQGSDGVTGSVVELTASTIRDNGPLLPQPGETGNGAGILAGEHSRVSLSSCALTGNTSTGILVEDGAAAEVTDSTLRANVTNRDGEGGRGASVQGPSRISLVRTALVDSSDIALFVADPGSTATLSQSLVLRTHPDDWGFFGRGIEVVDGQLTVDDCAVLHSRDVGVHVYGPTASGRFNRTLIDDVAQIPDGRWGMGAMARAGGLMTLSACWVSHAAAVGVVFAEAASGRITGSYLSDNTVALHVQGSMLEVSSEVGDVTVVQGQVTVSQDTGFVDNLLRLGSGVVPLPVPASVLPQDQKP